MKLNKLSGFVIILLINLQSFSQPVAVKIYPEIREQKIISMGGNYAQANYTNSAWDKVGEVTLNDFRPSHVRLALPLQFRDTDYSAYKGEKLNDQPAIKSLHETMKRMKEDYDVSNFTISVWRVPDELVENPERNDKRRIKEDKYGEVIEMIVAFLVKAKQDYGVEADYFSFNESDGGYNTIFSPEETIRFIKMAVKSFNQAGLKTKFLWADTAQTTGTVEFATMIAADSTIWEHLGPLSFHSWWSEELPDEEFERIAGFAKAWNREVWCAELGFDAMAWRTKGMNATWDYALRYAKIWHRMMKYARVEVSLYWTWQNNYSIMSADTESKYPSYYVTRHQTDFFNTGTQVVHSVCNDADILPLAGTGPQGQEILQVINMKDQPAEIEISGFENKNFRLISTTEENIWKEQNIKVKPNKNSILLSLEPGSINTLESF